MMKKIIRWLASWKYRKKYNLLYKLTRDGDGCFTFHSKCDGKGPTIIIIQTTTWY